MTYFGGIDAGGTTFKCLVASADGEIFAQDRFPTTTPTETLKSCIDFFKAFSGENGEKIKALGVACFGPLDVDPLSSTHGYILDTPKPHWSQTDVKGSLSKGLGVPIAIDTDVNGALAGELKAGQAKGAKSAAYVTIGTGLGAGIFSNGAFLAKPYHPEFGHIRVEKHPDDPFEGVCSFHGNCLEGLASATALAARFGDTLQMGESHSGWDIEAWYLGQACVSLYLTTRVEKIILGGGLMLADGLLDKVRASFTELMGGYVGMTAEQAKELIHRPGLGDNAGVFGAIRLAVDLTEAQ